MSGMLHLCTLNTLQLHPCNCHPHYAYARSHSRGARVGNSRGAKSGKYGGPQASSCEEVNISFFPNQGRPWCIPPHSLTFFLNDYFMLSCLCIKLKELCWYHSCIMVILLNYP
jgi:hypothetical protein